MADHYATLDDVNAYVPQSPFGPTSKPSDAAVTAWIEDVAQEMDSSLANVGYVTPVVTGTIALQQLRRICAFLVLGLAQDARSTNVTTSVTASGRETLNIWTQRGQTLIKRLCDPQDPFELPDAPRNSERLEKQGDQVLRSFVQGVTDDPDYDPTVAPVITRYQTL
jgi:hypothetical protein